MRHKPAASNGTEGKPDDDEEGDTEGDGHKQIEEEHKREEQHFKSDMARFTDQHPSYLSIRLKGQREMPVTKFCQPSNTCAAPGGPQPYNCVQNLLITPNMLDRDKGGSISLQMALKTLTTACRYQNSDVYVVYTLRATTPPVPAPTAAPTAAGAQATTFSVNMTVSGLSGLTPDVGLAFKVAMATTLNISVPLNGSTVNSVSPPVVLQGPSIFAVFELPALNATATANATRRQLAGPATSPYVLGMSITLLSLPRVRLSLASLQAMQAAINENFPATFNKTQAALGLGLGFLNITHMATTRQVSTMDFGPTTKPVSSKSEAKKTGAGSSTAIVAGIVVAFIALSIAAACAWKRCRAPAKGGKVSDDGISLSRTTQLDADRAAKFDTIPRISAGPATAPEWVSQRGSTITGTANPLNTRGV